MMIIAAEKGALVCARLKNLQYPGQKWNKAICDDIAVKLTRLKKKIRACYPDFDEVQVVDFLNFKCDNEDFIDMIGEKSST